MAETFLIFLCILVLFIQFVTHTNTYTNPLSHMIRFLLSRTKIGPTLGFLSEYHLAHTVRFFLSELMRSQTTRSDVISIVSCETKVCLTRQAIGRNRVQSCKKIASCVTPTRVFHTIPPDSIRHDLYLVPSIRATTLLILTLIFRRCKITKFLFTCHTFIIFNCH